MPNSSARNKEGATHHTVSAALSSIWMVMGVLTHIIHTHTEVELTCSLHVCVGCLQVLLHPKRTDQSETVPKRECEGVLYSVCIERYQHLNLNLKQVKRMDGWIVKVIDL